MKYLAKGADTEAKLNHVGSYQQALAYVTSSIEKSKGVKVALITAARCKKIVRVKYLSLSPRAVKTQLQIVLIRLWQFN